MTASRTAGTPQPGTRRQTLTVFDAELLSEAVKDADIEHRQLEAGVFRGELSTLQAGAVVANAGCYSRTLRAHGMLPIDTVVVGAILASARDGCFNGFRFGARDLICYPNGAELDYLLPAHTRWAALQLPRSMLPELGLSASLFRQPKVFAASVPGCAPVVNRLAQLVGADAGTCSEADLLAGVDALTSGLTRQADGDENGGRPSYAERARQVRCFEGLVRQRISEALRIPALCDEIGVSQRTLEQTFHDHLGLTPKRYLTILRLHVAREILLRRGDNDIAAIAAGCGLNHPGRFAIDYRRLFGELPSASARG